MGFFKGLFGNGRQKRIEARQTLRDAYWRSIGELDSDVLAHLINPAFLGMPAWPDLRQAYKVIRTPNSIIIGTDGLSDDFQDGQAGNGFGIELFAETNDESILKLATSELSSTWLMQLLFQTAANAAQSGAFYGAIEKYRYVSSEFGNIALGPNYLTPSEGVGVLLGIERKNTPTFIEFEDRKILFISVSAILNEELDYVLKNGKKGREELVEKLKTKGFFNTIDPNRSTVI